MKRFIKYSLLIVFFICLIEIFLRVAGFAYLNRFYASSNLHLLKDPSGINIICLGESSTSGIWVENDSTYPVQLREMLNREYPGVRIKAIVPPHVGQNTSQVANRVESYIDLYQPDLAILMMGYNNEWSLAESNIVKFLGLNNYSELKIALLACADKFRLFRVARYIYLNFIKKENSGYVERLRILKYAWGGPQLVRYPPGGYVYSFANTHGDLFVRLWRYDMDEIITALKTKGVDVILMTYHINPTYLPAEEFIRMARLHNVPLVRNDLTFQKLADSGEISEYLFSRDMWHPNKKGYRAIAENAFEVVMENNLLDRTSE